MKKLLIPIIVTLIVFILAAFWWVSASAPPGTSDESQRFVIAKGSSAGRVAQELKEDGLIKNSLIFRFYVQATGRAKKIQAGAYDLSPNLSLYKLVNKLMDGPTQVWVTIPEGLRREEILERFIKELGKEGEETDEFRSQFLALTEGEEGYLFPDTYLFERSAPASLVVSAMKNTFEKRIDELSEEIDNSPFTLAQIVILASIVERETLTNEERPIVAGILKNRLDIGMGLQADATVQYATANNRCEVGDRECDWWVPPTLIDLKIVSPFNTYRFSGLPPSPIANPGIFSLKAAVSPSPTDYFYYLHDSEGEIHYARTLAEHNANVAKYLR